ncbi:toll-like receptor 8 [Solea senegalensis]|uniref:Toll-like receptor 8 n=1 Tax=Solea senegalensis TaxID=28829 RepID=A0AAV6REU8_SOLSE|nr:toll-like receptor 8 [Solea senegalensis]
MRNTFNACTMTVTSWMLMLLFCTHCHCEFQPVPTAACEAKWMPPRFPCDVTVCNDSDVIFNCEGRHLHGVPIGIMRNATDLNLSENNITNISANAFHNLLNLTTLNLNWANINGELLIDASAFKNLTNLKHLKLTGNSLKNLPLNIPLSVERLTLNMNKINLDNMNLTSLANITELWISKNCYSWIPCKRAVTIKKGIFAVMAKLQVLDLSFNNLTEVPKGLPQSLQVLKIGSNQIQQIFEDDFLGLFNLKQLSMQGNCPRCQNAPYPCVPCKNISLRIHPLAFHNLTQLQTLHLGGNSLKYLDPSWFERLHKLKQLFLSFNFLQKAIVGEAIFLRNLRKLERLDLSFNFALKLYPETLNLSHDFSCLVSLRTLHLAGLVFQNIGPGTLRHLYELKNLSALNLGTNFIIHSNSTVFSSLRNLKMIYLAENRLYPIPGKDPPHPNDRYMLGSGLSLSPLMKSYSKDFTYEISHKLVKQECYNSGRVLILSSNNLFFISPQQFVGYGNIACLNLSGNGFSAALNGTEFSSLPNLTYLDLSFNKIDLAYDNAFKELQNLQVLDLSYNSHYFEAYGITHNLNFLKNLPALRVLNMSHNSISTLTTKQLCSKSLSELQFTHNNLGYIWKDRDRAYNKLFTSLTNLTYLDISKNQIKKIPDHIYQYLPRNLTKLCISNNLLTEFKWDALNYFHQLQILDLSSNSLVYVTGINSSITQTLTFLDLSGNQIFHLDDGLINGPKSLETLSLSANKLTTINQSTFQPNTNNQIHTLYLQGNPFECTCDSLDFILWMENSKIKIPSLTTEVTCDTPENQKGRALIYFDINQCVNDSEAFLLYILTTFFITAFMFAATVAHLFYWDASYVIHYMKAKLKGYKSLNSTDSYYGVFVTYDTKDPHVSEWVMRNLRVKLEEEGEKHLPLCLEERDWVPGVPLVDNLTHSIRYSRKTLFVLTEDYVKTGIFKLAMYLAHQRLLDENVDVIVLLMLEPVLQHSHFLRLRRRVCGKSVVEWPKTAAAEPWFWQNLRNVVRVDNQFMYNKIYSKYFTNSYCPTHKSISQPIFVRFVKTDKPLVLEADGVTSWVHLHIERARDFILQFADRLTDPQPTCLTNLISQKSQLLTRQS